MKNLISIIFFSIALFLSVVYTRPLFAEIDILSEEKASLNKSLEESKGLRTVMAEKESFYNSLDTEMRDKLNKLLPDSNDNVKLIIDMDNIASTHGLKIRNIDIKVSRQGDTSIEDAGKAYGTATFRFSVSATYDSFKFFMKDLEDSLRIVDITSLSFSSGDKDINEYNVELKTYWLKDTI